MRAATLVCLALFTCGCFSEQSIRMTPSDARPMSGAPATIRERTTRSWLRAAHAQFQHLLPSDGGSALLTEDLVDRDGCPVDVLTRFGQDRRRLRTIVGNFSGIRYTAVAASRSSYIDVEAPAWPGFETVWIPVHSRFSMCARVGYARTADGRIADADVLVIMPGFFGDNGVLRTRDLAVTLRECGYHVAAIEPRGHGQTEARYPEISSTFGVLEMADLMFVSDWLRQQPHVRRAGLIGFCWSANVALLAAWFDGREQNEPDLTPAVAACFAPPAAAPRFAAGIVAFSPILRWEEMVDELESPVSPLKDPILAGVQDTVRDRRARVGLCREPGSLRELIEFDYRRCGVRVPRGVAEGLQFLRLLPYRDQTCTAKLNRARVPVLIVHGANDPLGPSQDVADLMAAVSNPNVAAIILPDGGHVGFAAYARRYYLSLIAGFFDPLEGAGAWGPKRDVMASQ
ncbi:MAG: alpha/beta fold hydrolase [Phycisphaerae bacterium]|nr:alpha/beta hydrolase [Phycisphaerae bacterium]NUQ44579.1 alpha/beta fold hydrolase [Phycisphaerae bacterium]